MKTFFEKESSQTPKIVEIMMLVSFLDFKAGFFFMPVDDRKQKCHGDIIGRKFPSVSFRRHLFHPHHTFSLTLPVLEIGGSLVGLWPEATYSSGWDEEFA